MVISSLAFIFAIIYAIAGLVVGGLVTVINKSYIPQLPYTVVVFFIGLFLAISIRYYYEHALQGHEEYNLKLVTQMDYLPENSHFGWQLIVYFFLPCLIFGETMNLNWHHAISALSQATWLAGPGAIVGAVLMGALAKAVVPWMSWNVAFIFGSILAATDPVAVVALLKTSGASHSLTLLIVGESLLNDGSAMVLFSLFLGLIKHTTEATFSSIAIFFLKDAVCAILYGIFVGFCTNSAMRFFDKINKVKGTDMNIQVIITLLSCFVSFNIAQAAFEISGVLSASAAGLYLSWRAPPFIMHHELMHSAWSSAEWVCNTLIFFYAGLESGGLVRQYFSWSDLWIIFALYVLLIVVRVIVLALLFPIIRKGTLKCTVQDAVFMTWAGLRGALGTALGLIVQDEVANEECTDNVENAESGMCRGKFFVYIVGIISLTLLINATTSNMLLRKLRLVIDVEESEQKRCILDRIRRGFREKMKISCEEDLGQNFGGIDVKILSQYARLLIETKEIEELAKETDKVGDDDDGTDGVARRRTANRASAEKKKRLTEIKSLQTLRLSDIKQQKKQEIVENGYAHELEPDLIEYSRSSFLKNLRTFYHEAISTGKIGTHSYASQILLNSLDVSMDYVTSPDFGLKDWDALIDSLEYNRSVLDFATKVDDILNKIGLYEDRRMFAFVVASRDRRLVTGLTNYIHAHEAAQKLIPVIFGGDKNNPDSVKEIPEAGQLYLESTTNVLKAKRRLEEFSKETLDSYFLHRAVKTILLKQTSLVGEMVSEGTLREKDANLFYAIIEKDHEYLAKQSEELTNHFVKNRRTMMLTRKGSVLGGSSFQLSSSGSMSIPLSKLAQDDSTSESSTTTTTTTSSSLSSSPSPTTATTTTTSTTVNPLFASVVHQADASSSDVDRETPPVSISKS